MLLSMIILGITLSIDSCFVGITYGIKGTKIPFFSFIVILIFSILYAGISIFVGCNLKTLLSEHVIKLIGVLTLSTIGLNMIYKAIKMEKTKTNEKNELNLINCANISVPVFKNPAVGDVDNSGVIEIKEAFFLTFALSADSLVAGLAAGMLSFSVLLFPIIIGVFQTLFLCLGIVAGNVYKDKLTLEDNYISIIAGVAIIVFSFLKLL